MKERVDLVLVNNKLVRSRNEAKQLIESGVVFVDGIKILKPSQNILEASNIEIRTQDRFVGRGAFKLITAMQSFKISPQGFVCLDVGSSTGGFTEVLLKSGASKIYAVDVGSNQLAPSLRNNSKILVMENTDIRKAVLPEKVDLAVIDVSFISIDKILASVSNLVKTNGVIIVLIKPQFEVGQEFLNRNGVVTDNEQQTLAVERVKNFAKNLGLRYGTTIDSPILGGSGNREFLLDLYK